MATMQLGSRQPAGGRALTKGGVLARLRSSRPVQVLLGASALVFALVLVGTTLLLSELRDREVAEARRSLLTLNALLAESTRRTLDGVDLVLQTVIEEIRAENLASPAALARLRDSRPFQESLGKRVAGLPQLGALSVIGTDGRLISFSRGFPIPDIDLSDRDHFRRMRDGTIREPFLSEPVRNRGTGEWSIYLARRIAGPDGGTVGIVYAAIDLDYFGRFFASLALDPGSSASLWQLDGTLLARHPGTDAVGRRFTTPAFQELRPDSPPVVYEGVTTIDGDRRLVARQVVASIPLATAMTRSMADVLRAWREQAWVFGAAGLLVALSVVAVTATLLRQFWAYEDVARAEREKAAAMRGLGELEEQLRQSQKLEVMGQLTSGVAHDFNNLLTVVVGNLDRLSRRLGPDQANLLRYVESARGGADRAAGLCHRLLAFSRRQPLAPTRLDVNDVVRGMEDLLQQTLGRRASLTLDLSPGLPSVFADRSGLESALLNLVVNARDAMAMGGSVTISTREGEAVDASSPSACLAVADTGTGMTPEVLTRAFEPFFTTKEPGLGTGLGLAQVYGFARQSGGTVAIDSREGHGTRVTICLPHTAAPSEEVAP